MEGEACSTGAPLGTAAPARPAPASCGCRPVPANITIHRHHLPAPSPSHAFAVRAPIEAFERGAPACARTGLTGVCSVSCEEGFSAARSHGQGRTKSQVPTVLHRSTRRTTFSRLSPLHTVGPRTHTVVFAGLYCSALQVRSRCCRVRHADLCDNCNTATETWEMHPAIEPGGPRAQHSGGQAQRDAQRDARRGGIILRGNATAAGITAGGC